MSASVDHERQSEPVDSLIERALSLAVVDVDSRDTVHIKRLITGSLWFSLLFPWPIICWDSAVGPVVPGGDSHAPRLGIDL